VRDGDTIVALSSGSLPSGVAVIRLSGPGTAAALVEAIGAPLPEPRRLTLRPIGAKGEVLDRGLIAWFPGPQSFTGEDCAELQVHGSPAVVRAILRSLTARPYVRLAEAGEFTRRAFENGKLDLTEVEGLGDLIEAETEGQRRQALARLSGDLSRRIESWRGILLDLRSEIEARLDFSDEGDVADTLPDDFYRKLGELEADISSALDSIVLGRIVREGLRIALAGPPNVGKSSLLNALAKSDVAIVTEEAGTTRDVRETAIDLDGQLAILIDMAGIRETDSKAEAEGVRRAKQEIESADLVLWLTAPDESGYETLPDTEAAVWRVGTKSDLGVVVGVDHVLSAMTGDGLDGLVAALKNFAQALTAAGEPALVSRERDRLALEEARTALAEAAGGREASEIVAESLRRASQALERLIGRIDSEAVLDRLFLAFCIGK
jgi:tRNA modification GTPase